MVAIAVNVAISTDLQWPSWATPVIGVTVSLAGLIASVFTWYSERRSAARAEQSYRTFKAITDRAVAAVEETLPQAKPSLEDEIADVSRSLSSTVARLRHISNKAEAFEAEVKDLVARAEAAKATANLHEDDARKIALLLGSETEKRFQEEINKITREHNRQIEILRKSGNRMAIWTFVGGVVLGVIGNIMVALLVQ